MFNYGGRFSHIEITRKVKTLKKQSHLSRLLEYAGTYRILTCLSWALSAAGALPEEDYARYAVHYVNTNG